MKFLMNLYIMFYFMMRYKNKGDLINKVSITKSNNGIYELILNMKLYVNKRNQFTIHEQSQAQSALPGETRNPRHHASPTSFSVYLIILHFIVLRILII